MFGRADEDDKRRNVKSGTADVAPLEAYALEAALGPLVSLANVPREHRERLVPGLLLHAIHRHVISCGAGRIAGAH